MRKAFFHGLLPDYCCPSTGSRWGNPWDYRRPEHAEVRSQVLGWIPGRIAWTLEAQGLKEIKLKTKNVNSSRRRSSFYWALPTCQALCWVSATRMPSNFILRINLWNRCRCHFWARGLNDRNLHRAPNHAGWIQTGPSGDRPQDTHKPKLTNGLLTPGPKKEDSICSHTSSPSPLKYSPDPLPRTTLPLLCCPALGSLALSSINLQLLCSVSGEFPHLPCCWLPPKRVPPHLGAPSVQER